LLKEGASDIGTSADSVLSDTGGSCGLSFTSTTPVATDHGKQAIGTLEVGEKVWAYNPQTHHMELEPIQHIWLNHDSDLVDLTLTTTVKESHGKTIQQDEVIHTNERHPFLTKEKGFLPVSQLVAGMHIRRADGSYGVVAKLVVLLGAKWMYNLTVAQDHTYLVGVGQWVVHNCNPNLLDNPEARRAAQSAMNSFIDHLTPSDLSGAWRDVQGDPVPKGDGTFWNHLGEVQDAFQSGRNALETFDKLMNRGVLSESDLCIVQCLYSRISKTMDYAENIIYRDTWTSGANVLDWWHSSMRIS